MKPAVRYVGNIYKLTGNSSRLFVLVTLMGTVLGLMDLACVGMLSALLGALTANHPVLTYDGYSITTMELGLFLIAFYSVRAVLGITFYYNIFRRTGKVEANLKARLVRQFTSMDYEQRLKRTTGSLLASINQWTMTYSRSVLSPFLRFCCDAIVGVILVMYFFVQYPMVVLVLLTAAALLGMTYDRTLKRICMDNARLFRSLSEEISETSQQALSGYKETRVLRLTNFFTDHIYKRSEIMLRALAVANTISQSPRLLIEAVAIIIGISSLLYLSATGREIVHELPQLAVLAFVVLRITMLISLTNSTVANLRLYRGVVSQLVEDYGTVTWETAKSVESTPSQLVSIAATHLGFTYAGEQRATVSDFSFHIARGEALVIVGPSGSGKTTIVDLLLGILEPTSGTMQVTVSQAGKTHFQPNLIGVASYLSQNAFLLNDTLRRNVALGIADAQIDDVRVIQALTKAKLSEYANSAALDTMLGDRGAKFSGGQKQRVVLARAFYHQHSVMVLDEATNAIDMTTEMEIIKDLLAMCPEITLIAITHRPEITQLFPRTLNIAQVKSAAA